MPIQNSGPKKNADGIYTWRFTTPPNEAGRTARIFVQCKPANNTLGEINRLAREATKRHIDGMFTTNNSLASYFRERFMPEYPAKENLKQSTRDLYTYFFEKIVIPHLGTVPLGAIDQPAVAKFTDKLRAEMRTTRGIQIKNVSKAVRADRPPPGITRRRFSDQTIRNVVVAIKCLLSYAKFVKDISSVPEISIPEVSEAKQSKPYTREECLKLIAMARDDEEYAMFMLLFDAGLRESEALGLNRDQIDFANHSLTIDRQSYRGQPERQTKGGTVRELPMSRPLEIALKKAFGLRTGFLFVNRKGVVRREWWLRHIFSVARQAAGLRKVRIHDSRHAYSTMRTAEGVKPFELQALLGHVDIRTTQKYVHVKSTHSGSVFDSEPAAVASQK